MLGTSFRGIIVSSRALFNEQMIFAWWRKVWIISILCWIGCWLWNWRNGCGLVHSRPACYVPGNFSIKHNDGIILLDLAGEVYGRVLAVHMIVLTTVFSQIEWKLYCQAFRVPIVKWEILLCCRHIIHSINLPSQDKVFSYMYNILVILNIVM